jgi:hypothetical protein
MPLPLLPLVTALLLGQAPAVKPGDVKPADQKPAAVKQVEVDRAKLAALTDGQGHYVLYERIEALHGALFYGDGKTFYEQYVHGGGSSGAERWDVMFWEPRYQASGRRGGSISMEDSGVRYVVTCGKKETAMKAVPAAQLKPLLESATLLPLRFTRLPHQLLRDDSGTYYFVDRLREEEHRDFRVFMGPRGKMKQLPLKDIVDDSKGTIYATTTGNLKLVANTGSYSWVSGKVETKLIDVPIGDNLPLVYLDLGPYAGVQLGTPCDDLM